MSVSTKIFQSCPNIAYCLTLGIYTEEILSFFHHFKDLNDVVKAESVGKLSMNGFANKLTFRRGEYHVGVVMKTPHPDGDNLFYECLAGQLINYLATICPFFVRTYGSFMHRDILQNGSPTPNGAYEYLRAVRRMPVANQLTFLGKPIGKYLASYMNPIPDLKWHNWFVDETDPLATISCDPLKRLGISILSEYIPNAIQLDQILRPYRKSYDPHFVNQDFIDNDLLPICLLVYGALSQFKDQFTHYDLHAGNILLIPCPVADQLFEYIIDTGVLLTIKCKYLPKIIDYGRPYFDDGHGHNSVAVHQRLCQIDGRPGLFGPQQNSMCCSDQGYWLDSCDAGDQSFTRSSLLNHSHDLKLMSEIMAYFKLAKLPDLEPWASLRRMLVYVGPDGTPPVPDCRAKEKVCSVTDMFHWLMKQYVPSTSTARIFATFKIDYVNKRPYVCRDDSGIPIIPASVI
jgi:hypothetical protein